VQFTADGAANVYGVGGHLADPLQVAIEAKPSASASAMIDVPS
jgi:hypothetical protein